MLGVLYKVNGIRNRDIKFEAIKKMPEFPKLKVPDYYKLSDEFEEFIFNIDNKVLFYDDNGNPCFTSATEGKGSEMVTWGVLAVGEKLRGKDVEWIKKTYSTFFSNTHCIYLNYAERERIEYWYLFYVNSLAGAILRCIFPDNEKMYNQWIISADSMIKLANKVSYDFNDQGYDFKEDKVFTRKDIYRQPDSIAGYGYNMLFTAIHSGEEKYYEEALKALRLYQEMHENPWYEIPNGSAAVLACAWLYSSRSFALLSF